MPVEMWKCLRKTCGKHSFANPGLKKRFCPHCEWPCEKVEQPARLLTLLLTLLLTPLLAPHK